MARVNAYTALRDPNGRATVFAPGDELPEWAKVGDHLLARDGDTFSDNEDNEDAAGTPGADEDFDSPETGSEDTSEGDEGLGEDADDPEDDAEEWAAAYPDEDPSTSWTGAQLQAYANDYGISLSGATSSKAKMVERIQSDTA